MTKTIGMIGGGQLCRMLGEAVEEKRLPFKLIALDPTPKCPGYPYLTKQFVGDFKEEDKIRELAKQSDIITYEIELGNVEILEEIERSGKPVHPSPETLRIIQDKLRQAAFLESKGIPIPRFIGVNNKRELLGAIKELGLPAMLKATKDSYDGRGIFLLQSRDQVDKALSIFAGRGLMLQEFIDFACEVSVIAARSTNGEIKTYPVGENIHWESILLITLVPARINPSTAKRAREIAARTLDVLKGAGVFGIEMFVRRNGDVLINEIAPRVHNSGHYTIEACKTSQFEQHLRAISGMPLGETDLICKRAVMRNILGDTGEYKGPYEIAGAEDLEGIAGVSLHMYGKKEVRQKRKMGHFTLIDNSGEKTAEELIDEVNKLRDIIKLKPVVEMEKPRIEIRTGSDSDIPRIAKAYKFLDSLGIPYAAKILSAHRTPQRMAEEARNLHADGFRVSIAAAGGSAHLPGMTASETLVPVVGLPVKTSTLEGQESLYSIIQMPDGIPVGTVGIGQAESAAILAAQIAYLDNAEIRNKIRRQRGLEELEMGAVSNTALVGVIKPKGVRLPDDKYKELLELVKSLGIEVEELEVSTGDPEAIKSASRKIEEMGGKAIITFAVSDDKASTTQLPGLVSENTDLPTIGLPISDGFAGVKSREEGDIFKRVLYNNSTKAEAAGYPLAGMGINRYKNAALYAAQICGLYDTAVSDRLKDFRTELSSSVIKKDSLLRKEGVTSFLKDNAGKTKAFTVIDEIKANLNNALKETDLNIGKSRFEGKVRDNYIFDDKRIIVTTDRISCFDRVISALPFKGQVLNQLAAFWFDKTGHIVANHVIDVPDPNVMVVMECKEIPVEVVVRGYITGSLWRAYENGERKLYGLRFPEGMKKDQRFKEPILTPTMRAEVGEHDEPTTPDEIINKGIMTAEQWERVASISLQLFRFGSELLAKNNLILVDTKYQFGMHNGEVMLIDEIHTPDSSRFWYADTYQELFEKGRPQRMIDKEYVRQWLISQGFMGEGEIPVLTEDVKVEAVRRYIEAYEQITGQGFKVYKDPILERIRRNLKDKGWQG